MQRVHTALQHIPIIGRWHVTRQLLLFSVIGVTNTAWDFGVYLALTSGIFGIRLAPLAANPISFTVSVLNSYLLNRSVTFRGTQGRHVVQLTKFIVVNLVTLALYEALLYVGINVLHIHHIASKAMGTVIVMLWNFFANKLWTFRS